MHAVTMRGVCKTYHLDAVDVRALSDVDLDIRPNCFTVISGPSGSGKTTLLNMIGCIDRPDRGQLIVAGNAVQAMSDDELSDFRAHHLGYIFQNFNLLPVLSVYENIEYPLLLKKVPAAGRKAKVLSLIEAVGLAGRANNLPSQLSGGQRQRVAIARALAISPKLVLADEPTANLDSRTGAQIIDLMRDMQRQHQVAFVFSSHDPQVLAAADDTIFIKDGSISAVRQRQAQKETAA